MPEGLSDPVDVAKMAAQRLKVAEPTRPDLRPDFDGPRLGFTVFFGWEQPSDPRASCPRT